MLMRLSLVALAAMFTASAAQADHRWRKPRYHFQPFEIFTSSVDPYYDEVWIEEDEDDEPTIEVMRDRRKRWSRVNEDAWWLEDEELEEESVAKPVKKKKAQKAKPVVKKDAKEVAKKPVVAAAVPPIPKAKPVAKVTTSAKATPEAGEKTKVAAVEPKVTTKTAPVVSTPKVASVTPKTTAVTPKASGKTVGCTGGAAIVTGLGFASVRPRICTGDTYAYMASKADGNYAIKLKATTGEVIDIAKLP